ncbi:MAG TPA: non-ribosomal peptide synthetase [Woeseiaceae bacterium]|nr:non-ribosomal peptide synthetase [Woeseiaceae bacterium]
MTASYPNLTAVLRDAAGHDRSIRFISGEQDESVLSTADLWRRANALLADLQRRGMQPRDELVIFTKSNESFTIAFWAAVLGGIVPVPVAVGISDEHRLKLVRILRQLKRARLFTEPPLRDRLSAFAGERSMSDITEKLDEAVFADANGGGEGELYVPGDDDIAFIQYSSGSTSDPKGVCLTHRNLVANIRAIVEGTAWGGRDTSLSWMPLTHDMGLIGFHLSVLAAGMNHAVMDTDLFVRRPLLWMSKAAELGATQLCSPNFGYKHFLKQFERKGIADLDLSAVQLIMNGAEPISWDLCEQFLSALAPYGLRRSAMFPVYGLAEATVAVSLSEPGREYSRIVTDRHGLRIGEPYRPASAGDADAVSFVKVGRAVRDCVIRIAGDDDEPLADGTIGNIQVSGTSVTNGIYGDPDADAALFTADRWLRTGDVGVIADGQLVITGRSKDIIIVNGQNYYPHDLEEIVAKVDGLDLGKVVVAGASRGGARTEELLVFLLYRRELDAFRPLAEAVRAALGTQAGLEVDHVVPVTRIPKTTSGKVQRGRLAAAYADGEFDETLAAIEAPAAGAAGAAGENDPLVAELLATCREFAKDRPIGADDNLFEVGVSSLTLTEIVLAIDEKHPGRLDISDLFDYPTVREIARFLRR